MLGVSVDGLSAMVGTGVVVSVTTRLSKRSPFVLPPPLPIFRMIVATVSSAVKVPTLVTGAVWSISPDQPLVASHVSFL